MGSMRRPPGRGRSIPDHTSIGLRGRIPDGHEGPGTLLGVLGVRPGGRATGGFPAEITIKSASIDTGTADRNKHLRSPDFLDVDRFPDLRLPSTNVEVSGEDRSR